MCKSSHYKFVPSKTIWHKCTNTIIMGAFDQGSPVIITYRSSNINCKRQIIPMWETWSQKCKEVVHLCENEEIRWKWHFSSKSWWPSINASILNKQFTGVIITKYFLDIQPVEENIYPDMPQFIAGIECVKKLLLDLNHSRPHTDTSSEGVRE